MIKFKHSGKERGSLKTRIHKAIIRVASIVACATTLITTDGFIPFKAFAYDDPGCNFDEGCKCGAKDDDRVYMWNQGWSSGQWNCMGDPINKNWGDFPLPGGGCLGDYGCLITSIGILMKMSGAFKDYCPVCWIRYCKDNCMDGSNLNYPAKINEIPGYENVFATAGAVADKDVQFSYSGSGHQELYKMAVELAEKGYYIVIQRLVPSQHWTPICDIVEADNSLGKAMIISQVGSTYDDGMGGYVPYEGEAVPEDRFDYSVNITSLWVFVCEDHPFTGAVNASDNSKEDLAPSMEDLSGFLAEEYFIDMKTLEENALEFGSQEMLLEMEGYDAVGEVDDWTSTIHQQHEDKTYRVVRGIFLFFGILIIVYSTLLFVAYQFDRVNNIVDISLLGILTFGRLGVAPEDTEGTYNSDNDGTKLLTFRNICTVSLIGITIGILIITGKIFALVAGLISLIDKAFKGGGLSD